MSIDICIDSFFDPHSVGPLRGTRRGGWPPPAQSCTVRRVEQPRRGDGVYNLSLFSRAAALTAAAACLPVRRCLDRWRSTRLPPTRQLAAACPRSSALVGVQRFKIDFASGFRSVSLARDR